MAISIRDYLKEEVFDEGLTRNIPAFARFFDAVGYSHGELTNVSNIARDCGVDAKTVKEYTRYLYTNCWVGWWSLLKRDNPVKSSQKHQSSICSMLASLGL